MAEHIYAANPAGEAAGENGGPHGGNGASSGASANHGGGSKADDVIDVEFEEKK